MLSSEFVLYSFDHLNLLLNYISEKNIPLLSDVEFTNPLLWEIGHILYFFEVHYIKPLKLTHTELIRYGFKYDSLLCERKHRFDELLPLKKLMIIKDILIKTILSTFDRNDYITWVNILHMHMHLESFYFTLRALGYNLLNPPQIETELTDKYTFSGIHSGRFLQGCNTLTEFCWDNEKPHFSVMCEGFYVANECTSVLQYEEFIKADGYKNKSNWCYYGWKFINEKNITAPLYWEDQLNYKMRPVCHVSLYEARAYAKWLSKLHNKNYSLPTETQWEYMCKFIKPIHESTDYHPMENVNSGKQMMGNIWEWCDTRFYPYDGFRMDTLYKEFSYPFFGYKYIIKGGAWCVPAALITPHYRNAQLPENRVQYIGFRLIQK